MTVEGITARIKLFFFTYPHSSAKQCCKMLGLDYKKYGKYCRNIKYTTKKLLNGDVYGRVHKLHSVDHREEKRLELALCRDVVDAIEFEALKRKPRKGDVKPFDEWFVIPNRNRMMMLRNDFVTMKVWKSGTCRVLCNKPMPFDWVQVAVQNALFKVGVDLKDAEILSSKIEAGTKHKVFKVGPVTPFKIGHYKPSLGLTILADQSHPEHIETLEDFPAWVKPLITSMDALRRELPQELRSITSSFDESTNRIATSFDESTNRIATNFEKAMQEHLDIIKEFREESIKRQQLIEKKRKRRRRSIKKPKPKALWKKILRIK